MTCQIVTFLLCAQHQLQHLCDATMTTSTQHHATSASSILKKIASTSDNIRQGSCKPEIMKKTGLNKIFRFTEKWAYEIITLLEQIQLASDQTNFSKPLVFVCCFQLKGTVSRDFLLLVFFVNHLPPYL
jgi:hypothetical protein